MLNDPCTGDPSIPFTLYALECEGEIDTATGKRNKLIKNLRERASWSTITEDDVRQEAAAAGIQFASNAEIRRILQEVNGW